MTFKIDGFLSPTCEIFRSTLRNVPTYGKWFEFAGELNRIGYEMLEGHETPTNDERLLSISAIFIRAHQSFQAALMLAERGMLADARVVLRSAVEGTIALIALAREEGFTEKLREDNFFNSRKIANATLTIPGRESVFTASEIDNLKASIADIDEREAAAGKKLVDIKWGNVAAKHCPELYHFLYRSLSTDGTHTNVNAIRRFLDYDSSDQVAGLRFGPNIVDLVSVVHMACTMFIEAAGQFASVHAKSFLTGLEAKNNEFDTMPWDEPADVSVPSSFQ